MSEIKHVAIIMDGNGRWAQKRFRPRVWGHVKGASRVTQMTEESVALGLDSLTLYTFSTENWKRPQQEISVLFKLLRKYLIKEKEHIAKNNIQFRVIGNTKSLPKETQDLIKELELETMDNDGLQLNFAFDYGSKKEIVGAVNEFIKQNPGKLVSEEDIEKRLYLPRIDLLIRTSGDQRISNFLLWQLSYSELFFTSTKWPDFTRNEYRRIVEQVMERERRFGATGEQIKHGRYERS